MRLRPLLAAAVVAAPAALAAQPPTGGTSAGPRVGVLAGLSSATIGGSDAALTGEDAGLGKKRRNGLVAGAYITLPFIPGVSIRPEVLYAQKGEKYAGGGDEVAIKLDYAEVPVLLQLDVPNTAGLRPALYVGPSFAFRVRCRFDVTSGNTSLSTGCDAADDDFERKFDVSGVVGGQIGFGLGGQSVGLGVRYAHGFTKLGQDLDLKNRTLSVYGSIEFPFRR